MVSQNQSEDLEILYADPDILVCIKPARVLSTDEPGGLPALVRNALGNPKADVRTVHRLDRVVSGVMVLARNAKAASELSIKVCFGLFHLLLVNKTHVPKSAISKFVYYRASQVVSEGVVYQCSKQCSDCSAYDNHRYTHLAFSRSHICSRYHYNLRRERYK